MLNALRKDADEDKLPKAGPAIGLLRNPDDCTPTPEPLLGPCMMLLGSSLLCHGWEQIHRVLSSTLGIQL